MCIIVVKPCGVKLPSKNTLKTCFENNPDGAGIMLAYKKQVYGFKGLMSYSDFEKKLKLLKTRFDDLVNLPMILHFRIGTSGTNIAFNTHPFPITDNYDEMRKTEWKSSIGLAHNGIISALSFDADVKKQNVSDTMIFVKRCCAPLLKLTQFQNNNELLDLLEIAADSKLAFLDKYGKINLRGHFESNEGCLFSNETYKEARAKKLFYPSYAHEISKERSYYPYTYTDNATEEDDMYFLMEEDAYDNDLAILTRAVKRMRNGQIEIIANEDDAYNPDGDIFRWNALDYQWVPTGENLYEEFLDTETKLDFEETVRPTTETRKEDAKQ